MQKDLRLKSWKELTSAEKLGIYLFAAIVGNLGGFVFNVVNLYFNIGWNAAWIQLNA